MVIINENDAEVYVNCNDKLYHIDLSKQITGYGEKVFMVCPGCGRRRTKLYLLNGHLLCRSCYPINVYRGIQNTTKGGCDYISYKMYRFGMSHGFEFERHPFHYYNFDMPKYKNRNKWLLNLTIMQALANMRFQTIFCRRIWDTNTLKSVLSGKNSLLYIYDPEDMDEFCMNWDAGVDMNTDFDTNKVFIELLVHPQNHNDKIMKRIGD
jgi:hypothetical protein